MTKLIQLSFQDPGVVHVYSVTVDAVTPTSSWWGCLCKTISSASFIDNIHSFKILRKAAVRNRQHKKYLVVVLEDHKQLHLL